MAGEVEVFSRECQPSTILTCWAQVSWAAIEDTKPLQIVARLGAGCTTSQLTLRHHPLRAHRPSDRTQIWRLWLPLIGPRTLAKRVLAGVQTMGPDALLAGSDVVIVHTPLTLATHDLIDAARVALMRQGALRGEAPHHAAGLPVSNKHTGESASSGTGVARP